MTARAFESLPATAVRFGVSVKTLRRRIAEGVLPVYRCGRILTLDPHEVDALFHRCPQQTSLSRPQSLPGSAVGGQMNRLNWRVD